MREFKIGIVGWNAGNEQKFVGVSAPYLNYFLKISPRVSIITPWQEVDPTLDLLVLPGGPDVSTTRYNQIPLPTTTAPSVMLEAFDRFRLPAYIEMKTPIFGICRGMQSLNVHFGGSLVQHLENHVQSDYPEEGVHTIVWNDKDFARKYAAKDSGLHFGKVTSRHHQCISRPGRGIKVVALSQGDAVPEIMIHEELPILGVQYHPESNQDDTLTSELVKDFLLSRVSEQTTV